MRVVFDSLIGDICDTTAAFVVEFVRRRRIAAFLIGLYGGHDCKEPPLGSGTRLGMGTGGGKQEDDSTTANGERREGKMASIK